MRKMRKAFLLLLVFNCALSFARPEDSGCGRDPWSFRHELRFGTGDMFFETMVWHNQFHKDYRNYPDGLHASENHNYFHTPHFSFEYSWHPLGWLCVGLDVDIQSTSWDMDTYDNSNRVISSSRENFYNLCLLPTLRFDFCRFSHIGLYASLGAGMDINGGSEKDYRGKNTAVGFAGDLRLFGITAGAGRWWGFCDIGGLFALQDRQTMFLMGSQLVRFGISYRL